MFSPEIDPLEYFGFVYLITCVENGRMYIGKKHIWSFRKVKGRRKKTESAWRDYWSSSDILKQEILALGKHNFERTILSWHKTKGETNYAEVREQFSRDVLYSKLPDGTRAYYNGNICNRWFYRP